MSLGVIYTVSFVLRCDSVWMSHVIYTQCRLCYSVTVYGWVMLSMQCRLCYSVTVYGWVVLLSMHSVVYANIRQCMDELWCYLCNVVCATVRQCMDESCCYLCTVLFMLMYGSVWMSRGVIHAMSFVLQYDSVWMSRGVIYAVSSMLLYKSQYDSVWMSPSIHIIALYDSAYFRSSFMVRLPNTERHCWSKIFTHKRGAGASSPFCINRVRLMHEEHWLIELSNSPVWGLSLWSNLRSSSCYSLWRPFWSTAPFPRLLPS